MIAFLLSFGLIAKIVAGLGTLGSTVGGLAFLGWLGPLAPFVMTIVNVIKTVLGWIWDGFQTAVSHPAVWALVACGFVGGAWWQHHRDGNYIEAAKIETANVVAKVKGVADVEAQKAKAAIAARDAAKALPLFEPTVTIAPVSPAKASAPPIALDPARPDFVRKPKGNSGRAKCDAVLCF